MAVSKREGLMKGSGLKGAIPRPRGRLRGFIGWWVRGPWWGKTAKLAAVAVILYNVVTFFAMWCPPVRGVVLDIDTHKPIAGAIVQKDAVGPFAFFPAMTQAGGRTGGGDAQAKTDASGRFSFPGVLAHPTSRTHSWFDVLWPFQWLDTIDIKVWHVDYIGAYSCAKGMWWREMPPYHSAGYCEVKRYRIPLLGFRYTILLKKPQTEADWRVKIGSVNLAGIEGGNEAEDERLFDDLTGYLERWPQGEMAGEYYKLLWETANLAPCNPYEREDFLRGVVTRERLQTYCDRAAKIIALSEMLEKPPAGLAEDEFRWKVEEEKKQLVCAKELLALTDRTRNGSKELGQVFNVSVLNASLLSMVHFMP
jgi:hypothetical protein